jgi:UDP-N-acetylglucosamine:LPS N-acetylglucosamine transferase
MSGTDDLFFSPVKQTILFAPLDWGLGHATRCIPLIKQAVSAGHGVIIAADRGPLALLKAEFPTLEFITFPGYEISYPKDGNMVLSMAWQLPKLAWKVVKEYFQIKRIVKERRIDWVISDNRYGLFGHAAKSTFITHQLHIKTGFLEGLFNSINHWYIRRFDNCWVPDYKGIPNLGGSLSHPESIPTHCQYIGPLSRFEKKQFVKDEIDLLVIFSGPEPQRSLFEQLVIEQLSDFNGKVVLVRGLPLAQGNLACKSNQTAYNHLSDADLNEWLLKAKLVLSRPGYSTVMDLAQLGKKAVFVPTPGQTEQEYLAERMKEQKISPFQSQSEFNLKALLEEAQHYTGFIGW